MWNPINKYDENDKTAINGWLNMTHVVCVLFTTLKADKHTSNKSGSLLRTTLVTRMFIRQKP